MGRVEWLPPEPERRHVGFLGFVPSPSSTMSTRTTEAATRTIKEEERGLQTSEKILILSLFLNVLTLAWSVYQWQHQPKK